MKWDGNSLFCSVIKTNPKGMISCVTDWFNEHKNNDMLWWLTHSTERAAHPSSTKQNQGWNFAEQNCAASLKYCFHLFKRAINAHLNWNSSSCSLSELCTNISLLLCSSKRYKKYFCFTLAAQSVQLLKCLLYRYISLFTTMHWDPGLCLYSLKLQLRGAVPATKIF